MKNLLFLMLCFTTLLVKAQDAQIDEKDGVTLTYKITKIKEDTKKDTYLITCKAVNKNDYDLFYEVPLNKVNPFFATVTVRNANEYIYINGLESKLLTVNKSLFYLKKGGSVNSEKEVKIAKGTAPIITGEFSAPLKNISDIR